MKNLSQKLKVRATGLTPVQSASAKHFKKNPDGANYGTCMIDAKTFLAMVFSFIASLIRPVLDQPWRATFTNVRDWNSCVQWQGDTTDDGYPSAGVSHRIWKFFTGESVPAGGKIIHACHDAATCADGIFCTHRSCVNPLHFYLTNAKGAISRSHNAPKRARLTEPKLPEYMKHWTNCKYGHDTEPGKKCKTCNAINQQTFRDNIKARRAERAAVEEAIRNGELFHELRTPTLLELTR